VQIYVDSDAMDLANRVLDLDPHRISVDELRTMASFIRAVSVPIVELTREHTESGLAPQPVLEPLPPLVAKVDPLLAEITAASIAWSGFLSAEFTSGERAARATLNAAMAALGGRLKTTSNPQSKEQQS
jgi:hypothetical protein